MRRLTKRDLSPERYPKDYELPDGTYRFANGLLRHFVYERDKGQCQYCGVVLSWSEAKVDHVDPVPIGSTDPENLVVACAGCNYLKLTQVIPKHLRPDASGDFGAWLRRQSGFASYLADYDLDPPVRFGIGEDHDLCDPEHPLEQVVPRLFGSRGNVAGSRIEVEDFDGEVDWTDDFISDDGEFKRG